MHGPFPGAMPADARTPPRTPRGRTFRRLLRYALPYWHVVVLVVALSLVSSLFSVLPPQVLGMAVDTITGQPAPREPTSASAGQPALPLVPAVRALTAWATGAGPGGEPSRSEMLWVLAAVFLVLQLLMAGLGAAYGWVLAGLGQRLLWDMRNSVHEHMLKLSLRYFHERQTGDLMSRVIGDVEALQTVMLGPAAGYVGDALRLCWVLGFCLSWDWGLTVLALLVAPLLLVTAWRFGLLMRREFRWLRDRVGEMSGLLQDSISGIAVIKGFAREAREQQRFAAKNAEARDASVRIGRMVSAFHPAIRVLVELGSLIVLLWGGMAVLRGEMSAGMLVVFVPYVHMIYGPILDLSRFYADVQRALAAADRVFEVLDAEPEVDDAPDAIVLTEVRGEVELRNVGFEYRPSASVLRGLSLKAEPGQMIAFVGPSGAGKSTALALLARFYDPTEGSVMVDGHDLRRVTQHSYRRHIGLVQQECFLFNDTVRANISYGKPEASFGEIERAARAANAHEFIKELPNGYETVVGERGVRLSGGQRQRIAIARAILAEPSILLLDEATSSVDTESERLIQEAVEALVRHRTTFVIAHRLSTVQRAHQIVVLDEGQVVEQGTHDALLALGGLYSRLHSVQFASPPRREESPAAPRAPAVPPAVEEPTWAASVDSIWG